MADPKILYAVVSVVFAGLAVWLAFVFRSFKEPWAAAPLAPATPVATTPAAAAAAPEEEEEDEEEEDDEDEQSEVDQVTVKNEAATEEAIEKAKKNA